MSRYVLPIFLVLGIVLPLQTSTPLLLPLQAPPCGVDSGSIHIADLPVDVTWTTLFERVQGLETTTWHIEESIWLSPSGTTFYVLDASSMTFSGPTGGGVDLYAYASIIDILAIEGIQRGIDTGYSACGDTISVLTRSCVLRSGSGPTTTFTPCGPECCERTYIILCLKPGVTTILPLHEETSTCAPVGSGCEQGCNGPSLHLPSTPDKEVEVIE